MSIFRGRFRAAGAIVAAGATLVLFTGTPAIAQASNAAPAASNARRACAVSTSPSIMSCLVLVRTDVRSQPASHFGFAQPVGDGYGPADLQSAYNLPSSTAGAGETVALVDAFDDPTAVSDLATYRSAWGLPACNTVTGAGCLTKYNQKGATSPLPAASGDTGWATEESLDVDMVSAICPLCRIDLMEASQPTVTDLGTAVDSAVRLGALYVSNSYGGGQSSKDPTYDTDYYQHAGVAVVASAGDYGYGVSYPSASQYVTSVGGTSLTQASGTRGWTETVWSGTGSGCAWKYEAKPSWQVHSGCTHRIANDVAAVADPNTGVAIYDTYDQGGWVEVGGTSVSSPIIASVFALAGTPAAGTYPSSYPYAHTKQLYDVTSGSNGSCSKAFLCNGEKGYDGPTGWGTPHGTAAFVG